MAVNAAGSPPAGIAAPSRKARLARHLAPWAPLLVLLLLCAAIGLINPNFLTTGNFVRICQAAMIPLVLGLGATFIILMGSIDLSVEGILALGAVMLSLLVANGANGNDLGWLHRGTGQDWAVAGAQGQGTDLIAGKSFVLSGIQAVGSQFITVNLDAGVVQNWINNPITNNGVILVNETTGAVVRINASEQANAAIRPKLSVTYTVGTPQPQPPRRPRRSRLVRAAERGGPSRRLGRSRNGRPAEGAPTPPAPRRGPPPRSRWRGPRAR